MISILVIGLGRFGRNLALNFTELGIAVTAIDKDEEKVNKISSCVTKALIGNCVDINVLRALKVNSFDKCFVCISGSFQSSLEITLLLKELGAKHVISKTERDVHTKFLHIIGADEVIYIDRDAAERTAVKYSANNAFEYIELTEDYAITEMLVPDSWAGLSIKALNLRAKLNVNIIGIKKGDKVIPVTDPDHIFAQPEHLVVAGYKRDLYSMLDKSPDNRYTCREG